MTFSQTTRAAATLTAGPWGTLYASFPAGLNGDARNLVAAGQPAVLTAGGPLGAAGLNFTGIAAVAGALNTYYSGLPAAKRAQLGYIAPTVSQSGISVPCHNADLVSLAATLAAVLDTSGNYGAVGT
jgi:hypothetical protein